MVFCRASPNRYLLIEYTRRVKDFSFLSTARCSVVSRMMLRSSSSSFQCVLSEALGHAILCFLSGASFSRAVFDASCYVSVLGLI